MEAIFGDEFDGGRNNLVPLVAGIFLVGTYFIFGVNIHSGCVACFLT
jgi:hypothetical protein